MIWTVFEILLSGFEAWIIMSFLAKYFLVKDKKKFAISISTISITVLISILNSITIFSTWSTAVYLLFILGFTAYFFKGKMLRKVIVILVFMVAMIFIDAITINIFALLSRIPNSVLLEQGENRIICIIISKTLLFILSMLIAKILSKEDSKISIDYWINMFIVPIISFIIALLVIEDNIKYGINNHETTMIMLMCFSMLIINIVSLYLFDKGVNDKEKIHSYQLMEQQMYLLQKYVEEAEETQKEISSIWHDVRNHLTTLGILLKTRNVDEAIIYLDELTNQSNIFEFKIKTGNATIDALLNQKYVVAQNSGISINIDAKISKHMCINNVDICVVLSNSIDNAIEACKKMEDENRRIMFVKIYMQLGYLFIRITNSVTENPLTNNNKLLTTKGDKKYHGIGIKNIRKIVGKYDGEIEFRFQDNLFILTVMLNNTK